MSNITLFNMFVSGVATYGACASAVQQRWFSFTALGVFAAANLTVALV